jgi:hypothetical protein
MVIEWPVLAFLTVLVLAAMVIVFALVRRVRKLQAQMGAGNPDMPKVGHRVGAFQSTTVDGKVITSSGLEQAETTLVGFFAPNCNMCARVRSELLEQPPTIPIMAFIVPMGDEPQAVRDANAVADQLRSIAQVAIADVVDPVLRAFATAAYPTLIRVERGTVTAASHRLADVLP